MLILNGQTSVSILTLMPLPSEYQLDISIRRDYSRIHRIKNPLLGIPEDQLLADVEEFAREKDLTDILPLLQKGALVAQNPTSFETIKDITDEERDCLRLEVIHKWRQPKSLYFTIALCSIGAAVQ